MNAFSAFIRASSMLAALLWAFPSLADPASLKLAFEQLLNNQPATTLEIQSARTKPEQINEILLKRYQEHGMQPVWVTPEGPGPRAAILFEALKAAPNEGLRSEDYRVSRIASLWSKRSDQDLASLEVLLSVGLAAYVADLRDGRAVSRKLDADGMTDAENPAADPAVLAADAVKSPDLAQFLAQQAPGHAQYQRLKKALADYRALATQGEWEAIPEGATIKPGMQNDRVQKIRARLKRSGDLAADSPDSAVYDEKLVEAVKKFQKRFLLESDGAIGKKTVAAMNIPISTLIQRIIINMERWRWLSHDLGDKRIFVNIAGFYLQGSRDHEIDLFMPVIVGEQYHKTPLFSGAIKYLEFNPYWNIPPSIASNEMYPSLVRDPNHLKKRRIRIFSGSGKDAVEVNSAAVDWSKVGKRGINRYHLRQDPGPKNSLGHVKFIFPNPYNVYLHDTPTQSLFKRARRDFSHGCIRVSKPLELASYLLGGTEKGWDIKRMEKIIKSGKRTVVNLEKPYPIHIMYRTAAVGDDGVVYFADDVYGRDERLQKVLF